MNKSSKIIVSLFAFTVLFSGGYYLQAEYDQSSINVVHMGGDVRDNFDNVDQLKKEASIIAEVQIKNHESFEYGNSIFSIADAKVKKVYKGDLNEQKEIKILETGGIVNNTNYVFENNEVFKKNEKAIVYLQKYDGPITKDSYVILGVYQGKFKVNDNRILEPADGVSQKIKKVTTVEDLKLN